MRLSYLQDYLFSYILSYSVHVLTGSVALTIMQPSTYEATINLLCFTAIK